MEKLLVYIHTHLSSDQMKILLIALKMRPVPQTFVS